MYSTRITTRLKIVKKNKLQQRKVYNIIHDIILYILITRSKKKIPYAISRIVMTSITLMLL